jgi:hypothetical protein
MVHPRRQVLKMENVDGLATLDSRQTYMTSLLPVIIALMKTPFLQQDQVKASYRTRQLYNLFFLTH